MQFKSLAFFYLISLFFTDTDLFAQSGQLRGVISDKNGEPVPGVNVRLEPDTHTSLTDEKGNYSFKRLFPGRYLLSAAAMGFKTLTISVVIDEDERLNITLEEDILGEVNITGQRENIDNILSSFQSAQIVTSITRETIAAMGSRRLDEVLREQTGMAVVSDVGSGNRSIGLQMQGFGSEYITILINGQPMGGRHSGNFDLSRISVNDIEKIEVIKGASCSFYGSEALGGTINIITKQNVTAPQLTAGITYGTYATTDATLSAETPFASGNGFVVVSGNYYRTAGFNVNPYLENGKTAPPYSNFGLQSRARWQLTKTGFLNFNARYATRHSVMNRNYGAMPTSDKLDEKDLNAMLAWDQDLAGRGRLMSRYYFTRYASAQDVTLLQNDRLLQQNNFTEYLHRFEEQYSFSLFDERLKIGSGAGIEYQLTQAETDGADGNMLNYFAYSQVNFEPVSKVGLVAGLRYDGNNRYGGRLNPTAGINYKPNNWLGFNVSLGTGFKTPTYRQLYQRFSNLSQGYTVLGTADIRHTLEEMQQTGDIQQIWAIADQVKDLKAESSTSLNAQATIKPVKTLTFNINGFYNRIRNLIISQQIGIKTNGSQLFSWFNIAGMYSLGLEASMQWQICKGLGLSGGYQLLEIKDRTVLDSIRLAVGNYGLVRSEAGIRAATTKDYFGLPNRSRHSGNIQVNYQFKPWDVNLSVRAQFRGRYGFLDIDNNGYIDQYDVFVDDYTLLNASVQKKLIQNRLTLQFTADNLGNYTDYLMPNQPGRMFLLGVNWTFTGKKKMI